jgi:hypothetical protein
MFTGGSPEVVPATGLEPVRCYSLEPESSASANSATRALCSMVYNETTTDQSCSHFFTKTVPQFARKKAPGKLDFLQLAGTS